MCETSTHCLKSWAQDEDTHILNVFKRGQSCITIGVPIQRPGLAAARRYEWLGQTVTLNEHKELVESESVGSINGKKSEGWIDGFPLFSTIALYIQAKPSATKEKIELRQAGPRCA